MERTDIDPTGFIASIDDDEIRSTFHTLDALLVAAMPGRSRTVWTGVFWGGTEQTIIGYGDIVQPRPNGKTVEWFAIGLARQKAHYSLYVNAVHEGTYLGQHYADRLGKVKAGSASLTFKRLADVDLDVLAELAAEADRLTASLRAGSDPDH